ncbi:hypothetical protein HPB48_012489 [Haemaphysalis longicornis]|uniref:Uncharacterized protein n=1 Tax=Haemaphysalis longicornis TaxID=44386 RepID=A0A9J6H0M5_HAELO|nr:hypothetical protein HPB48_012489 [Haemaphysalis longicornis]
MYRISFAHPLKSKSESPSSCSRASSKAEIINRAMGHTLERLTRSSSFRLLRGGRGKKGSRISRKEDGLWDCRKQEESVEKKKGKEKEMGQREEDRGTVFVGRGHLGVGVLSGPEWAIQ